VLAGLGLLSACSGGGGAAELATIAAAEGAQAVWTPSDEAA